MLQCDVVASDRTSSSVKSIIESIYPLSSKVTRVGIHLSSKNTLLVIRSFESLARNEVCLSKADLTKKNMTGVHERHLVSKSVKFHRAISRQNKSDLFLNREQGGIYSSHV